MLMLDVYRLYYRCCIFVRPATSDLEKRKLTEFPKFTMATFLNGQYFSDISIWYADTYPMRDSLMNLSQEMKNVYGVRQKTMMVGTKKEADKIPTKKKKTKKVEPVPVPEDYSFDEDMQNQILSNLYVKMVLHIVCIILFRIQQIYILMP